MSENSSDTESSCGWTVISNEGSDIETLGPEIGGAYDPEEAGGASALASPASPQGGDVDSVVNSSLDITLKADEEAVVEAEHQEQQQQQQEEEEVVEVEEEPATQCSSSEHSDIVTLGDAREAELGMWEETVAKGKDGAEEQTSGTDLYLGTSSSSQYTFSASETALPPERPVRRASSSTSTEDEEGVRSTGPAVRRRRVRRSTLGSEQEETQQDREDRRQQQGGEGMEDGDEEEEEEVVGQQKEARPALHHQRPLSGTLNKCILLALLVAVSMGFGHFYGTVQVQERQRMVEKIRLGEPSDSREPQPCQEEQSGVSKVVESLKEDLEEKRDLVMSLSGSMDKITKENLDLRAKEAELQAQREVLFEQLQQFKSDMESQKQHLVSENRQLKSSLEREEASLQAVRDELRRLRAQVRHLEERGDDADAVTSENRRLKDHLLEEKQRLRNFLDQKEALLQEAQALRRELDQEREVNDRLREELLGRRDDKDPASEGDSETEELQARLQELEQKLSFEQQRSDLWERLYVESKEVRAKGEQQEEARTKPKPQKAKTMMGKVKETFDAVKNSTKEFVHHHKEQINKAKEAVKENLRKFSDSVKRTFRHLKNSVPNVFGRNRRPHDRRCQEKKDAKPEQQDLRKEEEEEERRRSEEVHCRHHGPPHQHPRKCTVDSSLRGDRNTRKEGAPKRRGFTGRGGAPKGCSGVFDCAYQESMSLFNKALDPIRADEFKQLLRSYLQREVGHFRHWRELDNFIKGFFHNGVFIHDQMLFTDFVSGVEDYLEDMDEYRGTDDEAFEHLDDYIYSHFFGDTYSKRHGPSRPFHGPGSKVRAERRCRQQRKQQHHHHQQQQQHGRPPTPARDRKWARSGRGAADTHFAEVKIELGPVPFDPKY